MYRRSRYYDPATGRFTQEDPIGLAGGLNLYGYANGDPVNFSDPFGLCPQCLLGAAVGVGTGYAIAKLTGQEYTLGDAVGDAAIGAISGGIGHLAKLRTAAKAGVQANRIAGQAGEQFLARAYGGAQQVTKATSRGARVIDNLADGVAMESKVGRTSLTGSVRQQIAKDVELINNRGSGVTSVEWHFFPGKTGTGPTAPLREALHEAGIKIVVH